MQILGVTIDELNKHQALDKVETFLNSEKQYKIYTPNPEMLVDAQHDEYFAEVLNGGDLNICDGFGLALFSGFTLKRIPGVDFMQDILKLAEQKKYSVYLLGSGSEEVISNLELVTRKKYPKLKIAGAHPGYELQVTSYKLHLDKEKNDDLISNIVMAQPDIVFVAFGHGKQEKWIYENIADIPSVKIAMGVGGSFDFLSGKTKRAPQWVRVIGIEWLYRLVLQPKRLKRIWKATVVFSFYFIISLFK